MCSANAIQQKAAFLQQQCHEQLERANMILRTVSIFGILRGTQQIWLVFFNLCFGENII